MKGFFFISICALVFVDSILAQNGNISNELFFSVKKLDSTINLNNVDYELINLAVLHYTNDHRKKKHKKSLIYNKILEKSALLHSSEMEKYKFFSHVNRRNKKFKTLEDRAQSVGYKYYKGLAENLYYGYLDSQDISTYNELGKTITQAFIDSKSHNINLLDKNLEKIGLALVFKNKTEDGFLYYYFTQSFGTR